MTRDHEGIISACSSQLIFHTHAVMKRSLPAAEDTRRFAQSKGGAVLAEEGMIERTVVAALVIPGLKRRD
jgi:hypothetical protein